MGSTEETVISWSSCKTCNLELSVSEVTSLLEHCHESGSLSGLGAQNRGQETARKTQHLLWGDGGWGLNPLQGTDKGVSRRCKIAGTILPNLNRASKSNAAHPSRHLCASVGREVMLEEQHSDSVFQSRSWVCMSCVCKDPRPGVAPKPEGKSVQSYLLF